MTSATSIGQKLWNYCNVLRDAGLSYGDYLEQLTYLIFLKMMHERTQPPFTLLPDYQPPPMPSGDSSSENPCCRTGYDWPSLLALDGDSLESHYRHVLERLAQQPGTLGTIFRKSQNKIQEPAMLTRLIKDLINGENWSSLSADVKGDAYESLLERNAQDVKTGAGQYFTPRPLISATVDVMRPSPGMTICDPACGTGGFLLAAHNYIVDHYPQMDRGQLEDLKYRALHPGAPGQRTPAREASSGPEVSSLLLNNCYVYN
jgi:type I restriction enzyme M protein